MHVCNHLHSGSVVKWYMVWQVDPEWGRGGDGNTPTFNQTTPIFLFFTEQKGVLLSTRNPLGPICR